MLLDFTTPMENLGAAVAKRTPLIIVVAFTHMAPGGAPLHVALP